ncbi:MAG: CBS domain-containing protein [Myxococcales bacterium]|nr:MAG: CBS domain-containing protein [Myxococcales bacterium]
MVEDLKVADIMTTTVHVLYEEDNLEKIRKHMDKYSMRHLPVVDDEKVVGMISHRDVLRMAVSALEPSSVANSLDHRISETFVGAVMTRDIKTVHKNSSVRDAAKLLVSGHFGCLPVLDDSEKLVGVVTESDILKAVAHKL